MMSKMEGIEIWRGDRELFSCFGGRGRGGGRIGSEAWVWHGGLMARVGVFRRAGNLYFTALVPS